MTSRKLADIVSLDRARRLKVDGGWLPEPVVEHWPCRELFCRKPVGVTRSAIEAADMFDRELLRRRQKPIDRDRTMFCADCAKAWHEREQWKTRDGESGSSAREEPE